MRVSISGATGFIGRELHKQLTLRGDSVEVITRQMLHPHSRRELQRVIDRCDVVINLAGETIDQRWSDAAKSRIKGSRTRATRALVTAMNRTRDTKPKLLISASAVGIYPFEGCYNDYSDQQGDSFLSDVCRAWEHEAMRLDPRHSLSITRFGVVFASDGGALPKLTITSRLGFMVRFGSPERRISWIDREDLIGALIFIAERDDLRGVINICASEQTTQQQLLDAAAPITLPLPSLLLRLLRGEAAEVVLANCCATPHRLLSSGFQFKSPTIKSYFDGAKSRKR